MHGQNLDAYGFEVIQMPSEQGTNYQNPSYQVPSGQGTNYQNPSYQAPQQAPVYQNPQQPTQTQMFDNNGQAPVNQQEDFSDLPF